MSRLIKLAAVLALILAATPQAIAATPDAPGNGPQDVRALVAQATASLAEGYRALTTGAGAQLVAQRNEFGMIRSGAQRLGDLLARRAFDAQYGFAYTAATVELQDIRAELNAGQWLVRAREYVRLPFRSATRAPDARDVTEMSIPHTFVFDLVDGRWTLTFDDAAGFTQGGPDQVPGPAPARIREGARLDADPRIVTSLGPQPRLASVAARGFAAYGTYDRNAAGDYAYSWALSRNPAYRDFSGSGGDCTNFASQALRAGGWADKTGWYLDWNNWWYNSLNQTQSWTYVPAMKQFVYTSGRGVALAYLNDLQKGDMMQVDFGADGSWDHTAIVDSRYSSNLADIYVSYHTTDTRHRSLADFLAAVPIPGNNYMAWNIVATTN